MRKIFLAFILSSGIFMAQNKQPLTVDDIWAMKRIEKFDVSPDDKKIAIEIRTYDVPENKGNSDIYLVDIDGKNLRAFKNSDKDEKDPKFSPDGKKIAYIFDDKLYTANIDGSGEEQLTKLSTKISGIRWSDDAKKILFVSSVYPDCPDDDCNKKRDAEKDSNKVKASIFTELMYRHWDDWRGDKRSHLFLLDVFSKESIDLNFGSDFDVPPIALGSSNDYNFSPDGKEAAYTMNESKFLAGSTNNDIFTVKFDKLQKAVGTSSTKISESEGNDYEPVYSPDGKYIAFVSMKRAGFEADKQSLVLYNRNDGSLKNLTEKDDVSVDEFVWSPDSKTIYFTAANEINNSIYKINIEEGKVKLILKDHVNEGLQVSKDGKKIYFKQERADLPYEIFAMNNDGTNVNQITFLNKDKLANIEMTPIETFWSDGAEGAKVQSILIKPPFFDPSKKYSLIFLIHGGPQGHWEDEFHYRWNIQMFAAKGYVVVAANPRGSTGYGQKFTDEISGDWGGKAYTDLMNACDYAIKNFNFIDANNTFAAGASYGGYMIDWIEGHNDRFNALVSHDGTYNLESMYGTTEELWFPEWEFKGTPWENRELYEKWSPHRYIQNAKTPMLIIQGANDFRVPEEQSMQLFTALQRLGVPSKFLYFPDETHWVTKPLNAKLWWKTIFDWFKQYQKKEIQ